MSIAIKLYQKHHCGRELPALGFEADRIRTPVSMATDNSHRIIMGEMLSTLLRPHFPFGSSSFLQVTRTTIKFSDEFEIRPDQPSDCRGFLL